MGVNCKFFLAFGSALLDRLVVLTLIIKEIYVYLAILALFPFYSIRTDKTVVVVVVVPLYFTLGSG